MSQSKELQSIIEAIPQGFADPDADYKAVRAMFAPFHGHATGDNFQIEIATIGGVRCGKYNLTGRDNSYTAFHCHGGAFVSSGLDTSTKTVYSPVIVPRCDDVPARSNSLGSSENTEGV